LIAPYGYDEQNYSALLESPSWSHLFGTDDLGRDMFSRIVYGAQVTVIIGFGAVTLATVLATLLGAFSAYYGGAVDTTVQRLVEVWQSFPPLILLMSIIVIIGRGELQLILAIAFIFTATTSRVIRSAVLAIKNNVYFEAGRILGATDVRMIVRYVLPNVAPTIIVLATVQLGAIVLVEASLSFLGLGLPPPFPSWGQMLSGAGRRYFVENPWIAVWPGLFISLAVFGFNMLGDALRDVLDPRLRSGQ